jgi:hypothetical protein
MRYFISNKFQVALKKMIQSHVIIFYQCSYKGLVTQVNIVFLCIYYLFTKLFLPYRRASTLQWPPMVYLLDCLQFVNNWVWTCLHLDKLILKVIQRIFYCVCNQPAFFLRVRRVCIGRGQGTCWYVRCGVVRGHGQLRVHPWCHRDLANDIDLLQQQHQSALSMTSSIRRFQLLTYTHGNRR